MSTVDSLLTSLKLKGGFPTDNYFTDAELLIILNDEMKITISPLIMKLQEDYFVQNKDYTISATNAYRIPARALGNKLRDIKLYVDTNYTNLNRLYEEDRESSLSGYYITRNTISLSDNINAGTLKVAYFLAPSQLVLLASAATILSIDSATQVTVSSLPSTISLTTPVDIIQANGPNDQLALDQTMTGVAGTTLTFSSLPDGLLVGDYICLAKQSCVPVIPEELHPVLVQAALVSCLSSKKDKAVELESTKLKAMKESMIEMLAPRVESNDIKLTGQGLLSFIRTR